MQFACQNMDGYPPGRVKKGDCDNTEELNPVQVTTEKEQKKLLANFIYYIDRYSVSSTLAYLIYNS